MLCVVRKSEPGMRKPAGWSRKSKLVSRPRRRRFPIVLSTIQSRNAPTATRKAA
jgi:hypothetical protein